MVFLLFAGQSDIATLNKPNEQTVVHGLAQSSDRKENLEHFKEILLPRVVSIKLFLFHFDPFRTVEYVPVSSFSIARLINVKARTYFEQNFKALIITFCP